MFIVIISLNFLLKRVGLVKPIYGTFLSDHKGTFKIKKMAHYFYFLDAVPDYSLLRSHIKRASKIVPYARHLSFVRDITGKHALGPIS